MTLGKKKLGKSVLGLALLVAGFGDVRAVTITGADWLVHFNLPDQSYSTNSVSNDEYCIRNALLARINTLKSNDEAVLATFTFSGNWADTGAAGPILLAMSNALARGARVSFVADGGVEIASNFWPGISLSRLAARPKNPLTLSRDNSASGIMHDKLGVFKYGGTNRWVFIASWNFTGGASTYQWNMAIEIQNNALHGAYTNEMRELLAGRFHDHSTKSHKHDWTRFQLRNGNGESWVRFAPYPDGRDGGTNAQTDIVRAIDGARREIVFALNKLNRPLIRDALIRAANRGVRIRGIIPLSDRQTSSDDSYAVWYFLTRATNYVTTNRVKFVTAYADAAYSSMDSGEVDLVHAKWMVLDPWDLNPTVIHGSANWTDSALASTYYNDENIVFLRQRDIARFFYSHFLRITKTPLDQPYCWNYLARSSGIWEFNVWMMQTNVYTVEYTTNLTQGWSQWMTVTGFPGRLSYNPRTPYPFIRSRRK